MGLVEERCLSKLEAFLPRVCTYYEKEFDAQPADATFWRDIDRLDDELGVAFAARPLSAMDTDAALKRFGEGFKRAAAEAKTRARDSAAQGRT